MLLAGRGVYPKEAERRRIEMIRSYSNASTTVDADYMNLRFAAVTYMPGSGERTYGRAREAGVGHLLVASTAIGIPNSEYPQRRGELLERFVSCTEEARARGAEIMGLVAMSICPTEYSAKELTNACGMPVLDALACQIAMAEWWHRTGLASSLLRSPRARQPTLMT